ncbi:MAG TPA: sulfatase, partial [Chitinophagaceae bacterium]|nr:sulfatase [Chitinophagaceae bacterium]
HFRKVFISSLLFFISSGYLFSQKAKGPMNIIFILSDDHRYDFMGFTGAVPGLETPGMDRMAKEGAHIKNAFVTTSLCSPSRASILTGQYAHTHTVVDNSAPMPDNLMFFPQYLQQKGYKTAFMGKWHMGNNGDEPQKGFDEWVSFADQGKYFGNLLNINGKREQMPADNYITDELTDRAVKWMGSVKEKPFCLYLSHKGVHAEFMPAPRHAGKYKELPVMSPQSMYLTVTDSSKQYGIVTPPKTAVNYKDIPRWVRDQRYSWHGVDYMYHGQIPFDEFYHLYLETLLPVDESIQQVIQWVEENGLKENTMIVYMGDNGFLFGEHGLIDKRNAYEESMKVPMLVWAPGMVKAGSVIPQMILNIDLAPTFLDIAGLKKPSQMQGQSFLPLLKGENIKWRDKVFYEYYWEQAFPQTPTTFAVRTDKYKYIAYNGIWDINELYDLENDPYEMNNLIRNKDLEKIGLKLRDELYNWLENTNGLQIPLKKQRGRKIDNLYRSTY